MHGGPIIQEGAMRKSTITLGLCHVFLAIPVAGCGAGADGQSKQTGSAESALEGTLANNTEFSNPTGRSASFSTAGSVDLTGTFFQSLGTNGRACVTCHQPDQGWTVSAEGAQAKFD